MANLLELTNYSITFYIYCLFSEDFRNTLVRTMKWPWLGKKISKRKNDVSIGNCQWSPNCVSLHTSVPPRKFTVTQKLSKSSISDCQKISFSNCQNLPFQTVKIFYFKLSKFSFQTVKFSFPNCQNFLLKKNWLECRDSKSLRNTG
jgi:hypothetical protein